MLRLSKKVEYGLIALRHLAILPEGASATAREISEEYGLPAELCAKTLSQLARGGLTLSTEGNRGGYTIARPPAEISVQEVIMTIEGEQAIVECIEKGSCALHDVCTIKDPLRLLQERITMAFKQMTLAEML